MQFQLLNSGEETRSEGKAYEHDLNPSHVGEEMMLWWRGSTSRYNGQKYTASLPFNKQSASVTGAFGLDMHLPFPYPATL